MKHNLIAIGCAVALAGGSALAGQDTGKAPATTQQESAATHDSSSGGGFIEKTKEAFHKLGESVKSGFHKAENKVDNAKADKDDTRAMGAPAGSDRQQRMDDAYGNYKQSGKADATTPSK